MKELFFDPAKIPVPVAVTSNSASQVKTFETCERLWTLQNPHKLRAPVQPGGSLDLGTQLHKQIELAVLHDIEPPAPLAYAAWKNLPPKGSGLVLVEKQLTRIREGKEEPALLTGNVPWKGSIDYVWQPLLTKEYLDIWDHKSTTNMSWAKISDDLVTDLQLNVYARYAFTLNDSLKYVNVHHNYMVTSTMNETRVVSAKITREKNAEVWQHIETRAHEMQVISDMAVESGDVNFWQRAKPNRASCGAFGGCPFKKLCYNFDLKEETEEDLFNFDPVAVVNAVTQNPEPERKTMPASDLLKARVDATKIKVDAAVAAAPAASMPPLVPPGSLPNPLMAMMAGRAAAAPVAAPATMAPPAPVVSILPPDAPAQGPGIAAPQALIDATTLETEAEATEAKAKRTRRTKAEMEAARAAAEAGGAKITEVSGTLPAGVTLQSIAAVAAPVAQQGFTLCIGCVPVIGVPPISLEFVISSLLDSAAKQMNIANIHVLDYGKKASLLTELLKKYEYTASCYAFTTNDNFLEGIIMATVGQKATQVIRGVR